MRSRISKIAATAVAAGVMLAGCGGGDADNADIGPVAGSAKPATCEAVKVGPITRCENFYKDYWPTIDANLTKLYEEAKRTDGGRLVVWDWYELSPDVIAAFHKRFPDIKVETRGLTYNISSAIISAKTTGERNSDIVSGSVTSMTAMYDQSYWQKIDWTGYGVPKEFLTIGAPELLPDSLNGTYLQVNTKKVTTPPTSLDALKGSEWKGKVAVANYNAGVFAGYGKRFGQDKMVQLIKDLKASGNLAVVEDTGSLVSSGDKPVVLGGQLFNPSPDLSVGAFDATNLFVQFSGLNVAAGNKAAGVLWTLWNAYDPEWLKTRLTNEDFATSSVPFPGLPSSTFAQATGLAKKNMDGWLAAAQNGTAEFETQASRDEWNTLIQAADKALNS